MNDNNKRGIFHKIKTHLFPTHDNSHFQIGGMLQYFHVSDTSFFPLLRFLMIGEQLATIRKEYLAESAIRGKSLDKQFEFKLFDWKGKIELYIIQHRAAVYIN